MPDACNDPAVFEEFREALGTRDPKTIATNLTTMRDFVTWLATQPGGAPFHLGLVTETAIRGYMDSLQQAGLAPRTRSKALSGLRRFCRWAMDEGYLRRNPARLMERPTVVAMAPTELSEKQRFVLKQLVERHATPRFTAIFALGYWAGLRISEIAALRLDQCHINQRAGSITLLDAKGGKTRTLDLHNLARRALYEYLFPACAHDRERDEESAYVFTSQRTAWLRQQGRPDHLSERGIEHLWMQIKQRGTHDEWERIASVTFHDLRHDFAHRAREASWSLEEIAVYLGHQTKDGAPALATTVRYTLPSRQQFNSSGHIERRLLEIVEYEEERVGAYQEEVAEMLVWLRADTFDRSAVNVRLALFATGDPRWREMVVRTEKATTPHENDAASGH